MQFLYKWLSKLLHFLFHCGVSQYFNKMSSSALNRTMGYVPMKANFRYASDYANQTCWIFVFLLIVRLTKDSDAIKCFLIQFYLTSYQRVVKISIAKIVWEIFMMLHLWKVIKYLSLVASNASLMERHEKINSLTSI